VRAAADEWTDSSSRSTHQRNRVSLVQTADTVPYFWLRMLDLGDLFSLASIAREEQDLVGSYRILEVSGGHRYMYITSPLSSVILHPPVNIRHIFGISYEPTVIGYLLIRSMSRKPLISNVSVRRHCEVDIALSHDMTKT